MERTSILLVQVVIFASTGWKDPEKTGKVLAKKYGAVNVYKPKEVLGIVAIENMVKAAVPGRKKKDKPKRKKAMEQVGGLTIKPEGKPTLVPESDKREALKADAQRDFDAVATTETPE